MPRHFKVFRAHLGFYDSVVAAPSQKAAATAWGSGTGIFQRKTAAETRDAHALSAALAKPGVVLRRPFGSRGPFKEDPDLPEVPKLTAAQKRALARHRHEGAAKRRAEEKREAEDQAERRREELAVLDRQEKEIKRRREALRKKR